MNTVNLNVNHLRAALLCAGDKDIRYYLNGVCVEILPREVRLIATDGHRLCILRRANQDNEPDNAPASLIIPRATLKGIKAMTKCTDCILHYDAANLTAECKLSELADGGRTFTPIDGKFPDYSRVVPSEVSGEMAEFNPQYLADFADLVRIAFNSGKRMLFPDIYRNGRGGAAVIQSGHPEFIGVLMPMEMRPEGFARPDWFDVKSSVTA